jgi:hypothetical protein
LGPEDPARAHESPPKGGQPTPAPIDAGEYQERLDRITDLFASMMATVDELSTRRCPYKNRFDECTAHFGCRNQRKPVREEGLKRCAGDDKLDYRSAWEID